MDLVSSSGDILYGGIAILDCSEVEGFADFGGLLYELKKIGIRDGEEYQIDNAGDLLMYLDAYDKCKGILERFKVKAHYLGPRDHPWNKKAT